MTARLRTGFSFRTAVGTLEEVVSRIKENGWTIAPITDRASTFGFVRWKNICEKAGLTPAFGAEIAVSPMIEAKKPSFDHWTFLAKESLKPLNDLLGIASRQFRFEPMLSYQQLNDATGLVKIAGRRSDLDQVIDGPDVYVAASPSMPMAYLKEVKKRGFKLIACSDNFFPRQDDEGFYQVLIGRFSSTQTYARHMLSDDEWIEAMWDVGLEEDEAREALANRDSVLQSLTAKLTKGTLLVPEKPEPLRTTCEQTAPGLGIDLNDPIYAARLNRELGMIEEKQFEDYFYIVGDLVRWARERMCVGPARGSSCGSLVCFLLGITSIDPLKYDLLFERFIDINRNDLPDIDIDFSHQKRDMVFTYLADKYGAERVARLGTVAMFKANAAINGAAAALKIPKWETAPVIDSLIKRSSGDSRALEALAEAMQDSPAGQKLLREHPEMAVATRLENHPSHYSQHAAGVVLTDIPVTNYIAIDARTGATHCDKRDAEELDLLKIDALGLIQLSVFEDALKMAGLPHDYLDKVPLDDLKAFEVLNNRNFAGIFQFTGPALKNVAQQIRFTELEDFTAVTALARPGPLASGGTTTWLKRKNGSETISYPHPSFEPFTNKSYGVVIYQEQVMQIGREIGDLDWGDVTALRKAMSKSLGKEYFDKFGDRWKVGARKRGIPEAVLNKVWDDLCAYGSWSFNRSHSVAYGIVSYWCCWLKAHYPAEFAAATLKHEADPEKQIGFLRELAAEGIDYIPVDAERSTDEWTVADVGNSRKLIGPLQNVVGLGPKMVKAIMSAKARGEAFPERARKLLSNPRTPLDTLWPIRDKIAEIMPDPRSRNIFTAPSSIHRVNDSSGEEQVLLFCTLTNINPRNENELVKVAKRGYEIKNGPVMSVNLMLRDDTGQIFGKVGRYQYETLGREIIDRGKPGKCLYAIKGKSWGDSTFRGVMVEQIRYLGDL